MNGKIQKHPPNDLTVHLSPLLPYVGLCFVDLRDSTGIVQAWLSFHTPHSTHLGCLLAAPDENPLLRAQRVSLERYCVQVVSQEEGSGLDGVRAEFVVRIKGCLRQRKDPNPRLPTGMVELVAEEVLTAGISRANIHACCPQHAKRNGK